MKAALPTMAPAGQEEGEEEDGFAYLQRVAREAASLPDVTVAQGARAPRAQTVFVDPSKTAVGRLVARDDDEMRWMREFTASLADMRTALEAQLDVLRERARPPMPPSLRDRSSWRKHVRAYDPAPAVLAHLDDVAVSLLVEHVRVWIGDNVAHELTERLCGWIFALALLLQEPLDPDTCSDMQAIARALDGRPLEDVHARVALVAIATSLESVKRW